MGDTCDIDQEINELHSKEDPIQQKQYDIL